MKEQEWNWQEVALVLGLVLGVIGLAVITVWVLWNSPALLP